MKKSLLTNFLKYVSYDTISSPTSGTHPSTAHQFDLAKELIKQLEELGCKNVYLSDKCYCYAEIDATDKGYPTIGLMAHVDTAPDMSGANVKPQVIEAYDGADIILNKELNIIMKAADFPNLSKRKGETIVVTDGTTLLGADDKAGIAIIMEIIKYLKANPDLPHGKIKICFTPDEEIGEGADNVDLERFACDFAYTYDGDEENIINCENFNAASAFVYIQGANIHPGSAKDKMKNSIMIANEFDNLLSPFARPQFTEKYEGFNHLNEIKGTVESTEMKYIIRNHDLTKFESQKQDFEKARKAIDAKYGEGTCNIVIKDSYFNMYNIVATKPEVVDRAKAAIKKAGMEPGLAPIRGGTDGARLTYEGIITPNLGTGGGNYHGKYEYVSLDGMEKAVMVGINILTTK